MKSNSASSSSAEDMILNVGMLPWLSAGGQQQQQSHININLQEKYPISSSLRSIVEEDGGGSSVCSQLLMNEMGDSSNSFALFCGSQISAQLPTFSFKDIGADHSFSSLLEQPSHQQLVLESNDDELFHGLNGTTTTFNSDTLGALFHHGGSGNNGLFSRLLSSSTEIQPPLTNSNGSCISSCLLQQQQPLISSPTQARNRNNLLVVSSSPAMSPNSSSYYYLHGGNSNRLGLGLGIGPKYSSNLCGRGGEGGEGGNNNFVGDGLNASSLALNSMQALLSSTSNLQNLDGNQQLYSNTNNSCQIVPPKVLRPLETYPSLGSSQPTLFQKRAAHRFAASVPTLSPIIPPSSTTSLLRRLDAVPSPKMKEQKKLGGGVSAEDMAANGLDETDDGSGVLYETDEGGGGASLDKRKGKKGIPAKNLMAERRRRKKLNDRLFMLRSVVPKISKMDRASILGDAIDYLRELLKRINDLTKELESTPATDQRPSLLQQTCGGFQAPPPPINGLFPCQVKQEFPDPISANAADTHPIKVEVRVGEGRALNIHMVCARKPPGLLLSTMRALDSLGLDIQQAVISCFNGFALDVFQAEQQLEEVAAEEIKRVLLLTASIPATTPSPPSNF